MIESRPDGDGALQVFDRSNIPAEPPDEILYHHKARFIDSLRAVGPPRDHLHPGRAGLPGPVQAGHPRGSCGPCSAPVATLVIFVVVFSRVKAFPTQGIPYALYAFVGILCWSFFSSSLGSGGNSLLTNKALLAKTQFPRECFPLETMLVNALNTVLSWIPLAILFVIFGRAPAVATVWVPLFMLIEVVFAAGMTLAMSSLIIQMRDLVQVLPIIISLGIFATPVIWPFSYIPTHYHLVGGHMVHGHWVGGFYVNLQVVYGFFNPLGPVITSVRHDHAPRAQPQLGPAAGRRALGAVLYLVLRVPDLQAIRGELCRHCLTGASRSSTSGSGSGPTGPCRCSTTRCAASAGRSRQRGKPEYRWVLKDVEPRGRAGRQPGPHRHQRLGQDDPAQDPEPGHLPDGRASAPCRGGSGPCSA